MPESLIYANYHLLLGIFSPNSNVDINANFRALCEQIVQRNNEYQIGGKDLTVEVDKTLLFKRKYRWECLLNSEIQQY